MERKYYELTQSQRTILLLLFAGKTQAAAIPFYFKIDDEMDLDILKKAAELEFSRNDALRMLFKGSILNMKQCFCDEALNVERKISVKDFGGNASEEKMYFEKDARAPFKYKKGDTIRIALTRTSDNKTGIYINAFHVTLDATGVLLTFLDIVKVYYALKNGEELPKPPASFEEKIISELEFYKTEHIEKERKWYREYAEMYGRPFLSAPYGMDKLRKLRIKKKDPDLCVYNQVSIFNTKCEFVSERFSPEFSKKLLDYSKTSGISPQIIIQMGVRTYCSAVNERNPVVAVANVLSRRKTNKDKEVTGCVAIGPTCWMGFNEKDSFKDSAYALYQNHMKSLRFGDLTNVDMQNTLKEVYGFNSSTDISAFVDTYISYPGVIETTDGKEIKYSVEGFNSGYFLIPLYLFIVHNINSGEIQINYRHMPHIIPEWNVRELHENALRVIEAGIDDPDITVGELLDMVESRLIDHN